MPNYGECYITQCRRQEPGSTLSASSVTKVPIAGESFKNRTCFRLRVHGFSRVSEVTGVTRVKVTGALPGRHGRHGHVMYHITDGHRSLQRFRGEGSGSKEMMQVQTQSMVEKEPHSYGHIIYIYYELLQTIIVKPKGPDHPNYLVRKL